MGVAEWRIPVRRVERRTGGREGDAGRHCTGTDSNIDKEEKEEKEAGNEKRRGEERIRKAGEIERWRQRERERGGKRKRAGRAIEGMRSGRQMAIVTTTQKMEKEGEEGGERREKGQDRV